MFDFWKFFKVKKKEIDLLFNRTHFEEIYFKSNWKNYFFNSTINQYSIGVMALILLLTTLIILSEYIEVNQTLIVMNFVFVVLGLVMMLIIYGFMTFKLRSINRGIKEYLDNIEQIKSHKMILGESSLILIQDEVETIEKWSSFKKVVINEDYIAIISSIEMLFPRKSMSESDYKLFKNTVREKIY